MKKDMAYLEIILNGIIFREINEQYEKEQELMKNIHMLNTKMGDIYMKVFKCNDNIRLIRAETFGNIIIDDNHVLIIWDINGSEVEFYYEQYWDIMDMMISKHNCDYTAAEIVKAFENYYNRKFTYQFLSENRVYYVSGEKRENIIYKLEIFEDEKYKEEMKDEGIID